MRHPPAASPRTAPAPPPPPAPAAAERAERARAEGPKAPPRSVRRRGCGAAAGPAGPGAPGPASTFVPTPTGLRGPSRAGGGSLAADQPPQARSRRRPGPTTLLGRLPGRGNSLPCPRRPGRPEPGLVPPPRQTRATCRGLCRLQTALRSACELGHVGKPRQEVAGPGFEPRPEGAVRGTRDS